LRTPVGTLKTCRPNQPLVRHESRRRNCCAVGTTDTAPCSARGFLPQRASLATARCEASETREPPPRVTRGEAALRKRQGISIAPGGVLGPRRDFWDATAVSLVGFDSGPHKGRLRTYPGRCATVTGIVLPWLSLDRLTGRLG
jgi:hypothetical protein